MPNVLSLFAGGGGMDLGFSAAGFDLLFSSDIDPYSCQTLKINQNKRHFYSSHPVFAADILTLSASTIFRKIEVQTKEIDFIIGGPPCQAFSVFGKRKGLEDPRGNLVYEYSRIINEIKPKGFLFENVSGLKTIHGGELYKELIDTLSFEGKYTVFPFEFDVVEYGVPQFRSRVIIIGTLNGTSISKPVPTHSKLGDLLYNSKPYNTVKQAIGDMPQPGLKSGILNHIGREHSQRIVDRYRALSFGERDSMTRINKLHPAKPSYTIIVGSDKGGGKGHVHPFQPREVTPRESARLQTFPDWWEFSGSGRNVIRQVGNAVPPVFAAQLANHIKKELFNSHQDLSFEQLVEILELDYLK
jgi:DNA (cytosine-5)-methyltransferase 1